MTELFLYIGLSWMFVGALLGLLISVGCFTCHDLQRKIDSVAHGLLCAGFCLTVLTLMLVLSYGN